MAVNNKCPCKNCTVGSGQCTLAGDMLVKQLAAKQITEKGAMGRGVESLAEKKMTNDSKLPDWIYNNDFGGLAALDPKKEQDRMDAEMNKIITELDQSFKTPEERSIATQAPRDQLPAELLAWLESQPTNDCTKRQGTGQKSPSPNAQQRKQ